MEKSGIIPTKSNSAEDVSEYSDAQENVSAPTQLLAEFLYSVMVKDYEKALQYCIQILSFEPDNDTVKEFRPLIEDKLEMLRKKELEENSSSDSSMSCSSSSSGSSENLRNIKKEIRWDTESSNYSSSESDDESFEMLDIRKTNISQEWNKNGSTKIKCSSSTTGDHVRHNKELNISTTRTKTPAKLLSQQTNTRIQRRNSSDSQSDDTSNSKFKNPSTLHSTKTALRTSRNSLSPAENNNYKTFAWFTSIQDNIFGNKKRGNPKHKHLDRNTNNTEK